MYGLWLAGLFRTRRGRLIGTIAGVALTVALIAALGAFMRSSAASMTARAVSTVPVDWQVEIVPGSQIGTIRQAVGNAARVATTELTGYAAVEGFEARTGDTVQVTGAGKVMGIDPTYITAFPGNIRSLAGPLKGVLASQQTAANLHVLIGDSVTIHRPGLGDVQVTISGIVDLVNADSLFQAIGVPPGAAPQAPPDNILILPTPLWHQLFDEQARIRPDSVRQQLHVGLDHAGLQSDPEAAYSTVTKSGHNLEARVAGSALLANNLAARLDAVRGDALYAKVLFLFLGAPGAILAGLLTFAVAGSGAGRRRRDQSLVRLRGGSVNVILQLSGLEAITIGMIGSICGILAAEFASRLLLGTSILNRPSLDLAGWSWLIASGVLGVMLSGLAILVPAWRETRTMTVVAARMSIGEDRPRLWQRIYLDIVLLALSGIVFWQTASTGYQVVLAPEGVAATSVDYWAFLAPVLLWIGSGLLTIRLVLLALGSGRTALAALLRPITGNIAGVVTATLARQHRRLTGGITLTALAFAFATSTAIFNTTYNDQARVDAELTNGADVTVTGTSAAPAGSLTSVLTKLSGVVAAEPMLHRFAYVGADLQDLYGIDAKSIGRATSLSNAYFSNFDAEATLAMLRATPDGVLVSEETVNDFQLTMGDTINLRLQTAIDHQYHMIPFHFIGVVREFPTAPRDSFLVANADYVARMTGTDAAEVVLMRVAGDPAIVRSLAETIVATLPGVKVRDISQARHLVGSSLTAVDLGGLTRLELGFAILLVAGAAGLVLALGLADRRRSFAILSAIGAKPQQLGAFLWSEGLLILAVGSLVGISLGCGIAWMLVKLLSGVFDPPPETLSVPWPYLLVLVYAAATSVAVAVLNAEHATQLSPVQRLRELQ